MRSDAWLTNPSFDAYASTDLSRPPMAHPVHYPIAEHLFCLKRSEVLPFNGDAKGIHNLRMDVAWLLQNLHGLLDVMLILEYRCSFLRCSGTCIRLRETLLALIRVLSLRVRRECRARNVVYCYLLWGQGETVCLPSVETCSSLFHRCQILVPRRRIAANRDCHRCRTSLGLV